ncbi:hypothetical protein [Ornithinimicrobium sp. INDO-MA30-4]|uniref:hypothetical protein n=1 Tax=Ornithinimicrobium sp. INDO-MA30-4 TaxID=2908651 RepID=UPI001F198CA9|nr:hypothetical protein [Ornithinimicrobium sp. INDO-MA30-4]UJH69515.1 hypothetical protein L0A91_08985 [Ornithinimicrobium sp. INDO-MA30-4]
MPDQPRSLPMICALAAMPIWRCCWSLGLIGRPTPTDVTTLAARATTRSSVQRALDALDLAHLHTLEAVVVGHPPAAPKSPAYSASQCAQPWSKMVTDLATWR